MTTYEQLEGIQVCWTSCDGAGSSERAFESADAAIAEATRMQESADSTGNLWCTRYYVRRAGRQIFVAPSVHPRFL